MYRRPRPSAYRRPCPTPDNRSMANRTVEEVLRRVEDRAAMLRHHADNAGDEPIDRRALSGIADCCEEIEEDIAAVKRTLSVDVLGEEIKPRADDEEQHGVIVLKVGEGKKRSKRKTLPRRRRHTHANQELQNVGSRKAKHR